MRIEGRLLRLSVLFVLLASPASGEITISPEVVVAGETAKVSVELDGAPVAGAPVVAIYRPGSQVPETDEIGVTSERGTLDWVPRAGGLVRLQAGEWRKDVGVRFPGFPWTGLTILIAAGGLLAGGVLSQTVPRLRPARRA